MFISVSIFSFDEVDLWKGERKFIPAKALATAGAQNIGATKTEAAYLNPATLVTKDRKYMMGFDASYTDSDVPTEFIVSAVDSRTSMVAGGAYVSYYNYNRKKTCEA